MAVTIAVSRFHHTETTSTTEEFCTATVSGTYVAGGFTLNPFSIEAGLGSSPLCGSSVVAIDWYSPKGYQYVSTTAGLVTTTKIFSTPGTELAAGAIPDATVNFTIVKRKN
jgi:hypothetical protein